MKQVIFSLFIIFLSFYIGKLVVIQCKYGIKGYVLGKQKKDIEVIVKIGTLLWGITWFYCGIWGPIEANFITMLGIISLSVGLLLFIIAMMTMGRSWRVGVDDKSHTELVEEGLFKISRNPTFVGFDLMFIGLVCVLPHIWTLFIAVLNIIGLHYLILKEEKHLETMLGESYRVYKKRVPRYLKYPFT